MLMFSNTGMVAVSVYPDSDKIAKLDRRRRRGSDSVQRRSGVGYRDGESAGNSTSA
jgi:hypothetical protein